MSEFDQRNPPSLSLVRASQDPVITQAFLAGNIQVLQEFDCMLPTLTSPSWINDPGTLLLLAHEPGSNALIGGERIHCRWGTHRLPVEILLDKLDPQFNLKIAQWGQTETLAEVCGLWLEQAHRRSQFGNWLTEIAVCLAVALGNKRLLGLVSPHLHPFTTKLGYTIVTESGENGSFKYPDDRYTSYLNQLLPENLTTNYPIDQQLLDRLVSSLPKHDTSSSTQTDSGRP